MSELELEMMPKSVKAQGRETGLVGSCRLASVFLFSLWNDVHFVRPSLNAVLGSKLS
jgi:hypothetical protein